MAKNRHSATCLNITPFDVYLKENYFPINSNGGVCNIRGAIMDNYPDDERFSPTRIEEITSKLTKEQSLSAEDETFIAQYVTEVKKLLKEKDFQAKVQERLARAGVKRNAVSTMYATFKNKFPVEYRNEVLMQVVADIIRNLDVMETWSAYKHLTRAEILEEYGVAKFLEAVRKDLEDCYNGIEEPSEVQKKIFDTILKDRDALEAVFYMARTKLFEAEKIKVGLDTESVEEDDEGLQLQVEEIQSAETHGSEHWMLKTDTISSFNSMSKENRSILYKLTTNEYGILGLPSIIDTMLIHQQLMELRQESGCTNSSEFLEALENLDKDKCPWAAQLYNILKTNAYRRTSFFNVYRKNHLNYLSVKKKYEVKHGGYVYYEDTNKSNPDIPYQVYVAEIYDIEDTNNCLFDSNGNIIRSRQKQLKERLTEPRTIKGVTISPVYTPTEDSSMPPIIENWNPSIGKDPQNPTKEEVEEKKRDFINTINAALNLHLSKSEVDDLMEPSKFDVFLRNSIAAVTQGLTKYNRIESLIDDSYFYKVLKNIAKISKQHISLADRKSPIEKTFRFNGSTYVTYTMCNHIGDLLEKISSAGKEAVRKNDITVFRKFIEDNFLKCRIYATEVDGKYVIHNMWIKELYNSSLDDLQSTTSFFSKFTSSLQRVVGMDEKDFEDMTEKEDYIMYINSYALTMRDTGGKFGKFPLFVTGDSNSTRLITAPVKSVEDILESYKEVFAQELERMQMFSDFVEFCNRRGFDAPSQIESNSKKFTILTFLNAHADEILLEKDADKRIEKASKYIEEYLEGEYNKWLEQLRTEKSSKDTPLVRKGEPLLNREALVIPDADIANNLDFLQNYYYNYRYAMIQQLQFLTVDPGFYNGTNDMQKRYKEMIAAGTPLDLEAVDPSDPTKKIDDNNGKQDVIYVKEQKFPSQPEVLKALEEAKDSDGNPIFDTSDYKESTGTDGQAWRSFTSYRKIMVMLGKWTPEMEEVWNIIQGARARAKTDKTKSRLTKEELEKILDLGVVFQPIKPFYYGIEKLPTKDGKEIHLPVQHKCSEYPIIPELLPEGNALAELGEALEDTSTGKSYDLAICTSAVKVGNFGATNIKGLKDAKSIREALDKGYRHELSLEGWREQSNVPEHADCSRQIGTQLKLHWLSNIAGTMFKKYPFLKEVFPSGMIQFTENSEPIDISQGLNEGTLVKLYNNLAGHGYIRSTTKLIKELSDPNKMSDLLSNLRANDAREADDGIDAYTTNEKGEMNLSPCEGLSAKDNMAALLSMIRKYIIKQGMKGGSLVQVSTYGFQDVLKIHTAKTRDGKTNITYADCVTCFDFSVTDENGNLIKLKYTDYVDPATGNLLKADGTALTDEEIDADENWRAKTKLERDYPGIIDMLAYRIPTEGHCSTLNLKPRKFLPLTAGAIIIVPALYTTIAGFDFDIDKLYFIRREYRAKKLSRVQKAAKINKVWNAIYGKPNDKKSKGTSWIYKRLVAAREQAEAASGNEGGVVAQSSNTQAPTLGNLLDEDTIREMYANAGLTSEEDFLKAVFEEEDEDLDAVDDGLTDEEREAQADETEEFERLYQYWELAGLDRDPDPDNPEDGGTGKSAVEFFEDFVADHFNDYIEFEKYDQRKPMSKQSQTVINNILFSLYQARLEDYDTFQERYTPSGFDNLKAAKHIMLAIRYAAAEGLTEELAKCDTFDKLKQFAERFKGYTPEYDATDIATLVHYQTQNALYDKLIGISANQNINQKYTSLTEIFRLKKPIKWGSMLESEDSGMGKDVKKRFMKAVNPITGEKKTLDTEISSRENLGASVDAVKDALLEFFGMTINNFNVASFMGKIGAQPVEVGLLLNQPIVGIAMDIIANSKGFVDLSEALYAALEKLSDKDTAERYIKDNLPAMKGSEEERQAAMTFRDKYVSMDALTKGITLRFKESMTAREEEEFLMTQVAVISLLQELQSAATVLSDQINVTKTTSANSVQSDFGSVEATEQRAEALISQMQSKSFPFEIVVTSRDAELRNVILDPSARIDDAEEFMDKYSNSPYGLAQIAYSAVMTFIDSIINRYFPYRSDGFKAYKNILAKLTNKNKLNSEIINAANKFIPMYLMERMVPLFTDNNYPEIINVNGNPIKFNVPNKYFYKVFFPKVLIEILSANQKRVASGEKGVIDYSQIPLLQYITPKRERLTKGIAKSNYVLKAETIGGLRKEQKNLYIESWEQMFKSEDPILRNLAMHLFMYSYYAGGFDFGTTTFMSLVPLALKESLGITEENENDGYAKFFNRLFNLKEAVDPAFLIEKGATVESLFSIKNAVKSFLANYCTKFTQFSKVIYSKKDDLYVEIEKKLEDNGASFTIDFTGKDKDNLALKGLIAEPITEQVGDTKITKYKMKPCVVIQGDSPVIYMCDINWEDDSTIDFNICKGKITYYRINTPMGKDASDVTKNSEADNLNGYTSSVVTGLAEISMGLQEIDAKRQALEAAENGVEDNEDETVIDPEEKFILELQGTIKNIIYDLSRKEKLKKRDLLSLWTSYSGAPQNIKTLLNSLSSYIDTLDAIEKEIQKMIGQYLNAEIGAEDLIEYINNNLLENSEYKERLDKLYPATSETTGELLASRRTVLAQQLSALKEAVKIKDGGNDRKTIALIEDFEKYLGYLVTAIHLSGTENSLLLAAVLREFPALLKKENYNGENTKLLIDKLNEELSNPDSRALHKRIEFVLSKLKKIHEGKLTINKMADEAAKDSSNPNVEETCS